MSTTKKFVAKNGLDNNSKLITNVLDPVSAQDAATKNYVTNQISTKADVSGITMSGNIVMPTTTKITLTDAPSTGTDAVNKTYVDANLAGLTWKSSVKVATTANITLSGPQTIDGVSALAGNRVLVKNQSTASQNGVYVVAGGTWSRSTDMDSTTPLNELNSAAVFVEQGTTQADTGWTQVNDIVTLDSDAVAFTQFNGAAGIIAGTGLSKTGNTLSVTAAQSTITSVGQLTSLATGPIVVIAADGTFPIGIKGTTKGIRFSTNTGGSSIEGVDSTLTATYQPVTILGSQVTIQDNGGTGRVYVSPGAVAVTGTLSVTGGISTNTNLLVSNTSPSLLLNETDAATNAKTWQIVANGSTLSILALTDAFAYISTPFTLSRTGDGTFYGRLTVNGQNNSLLDTTGSTSYFTLDFATAGSTTTGTFNQRVIDIVPKIQTATGTTNSGTITGLWLSTLRNQNVGYDGDGTNTTLTGCNLNVGNYNASAINPHITNCTGMAINTYGTTGTIDSLYGLFIGFAGGGTVTNNYAIYQASSSQINYLTGNTSFVNSLDSTSTTTGAIKVTGGVGIAKSLYVGGTLNVTGQIGVGGANYGTSGQVLTSSGPSTAPTWTTPAPGGVTSLATSGVGVSVNASTGAVTLTSNATSANTASTIVARDASGNFAAGVITATSTVARYADLAEKYTSDAEYEPGTVVRFGGDAEVTISPVDGDRKVAGVVSSNPAYLMNAELDGITVAVALQGRVPVKVTGQVKKGDMLISAGNGYARSHMNPITGQVIGKALQDFDGINGVIEVVVGRL